MWLQSRCKKFVGVKNDKLMKNEIMNQLDAELAHAGEETALSPGMLLLEQLRITPETELKPMEFLFSLFGKPCFPRGELVAITGKAKSGKTFVTSMLMAASLAPSGGYLRSLRRACKERLRVLLYDTEQSDESTQDILTNRIMRMVNADSGTRSPLSWREAGGEAFNVRSVGWKLRRELLKEAIERCKPDLVIVDGIRDLVNDINDGVLAQELMEELMHLATAQNCCIVCVLHRNKSVEDRSLRGWIGTELTNKAFEVYACEKMMPQRIFKLEQTLTRKYDIGQTLYFEVGADGLPLECGVPAGDGGGECAPKKRLPQLNPEYIVHDEGARGGWQFDVSRLFLDAMRSGVDVSGNELRDKVMQLSGIVVPFKYNKLLDEALKRKIIVKAMHENRTVYRPARGRGGGRGAAWGGV
ncbi:MAG: AAA family ATPase, partial [Prevotella sp.]|nr:AAA family ATPase [Prevotella sp.]